ncbi:hypothetical protein [uncultured Bacteroides sp.]|uniref:hypothetical protein n=1 Tax=uncultured Bacteroides sp. TaxID=162156 RepID=UPI002AABFEEF|nr:hypothetical protein [uncultured Bacteroides sp.]
MIAANIGKVFLCAYNEKHKSNYSAKEFFVEKYFRLFFDDEKYMQWITNSPFVQGIKKGVAPTSDERKLKLDTLIEKITTNDADASIAIGFPSLDVTATTSGQITNMKLPLKEEDVYLSWIGSGFGIGVQSGLSMFFDNKQILLDTYEGWEHYRGYLNKLPQLRGNQINTWNGQWIAHRYNGDSYDELRPLASFDPYGTKNGDMEVTTQSWLKVLIGIARNYPDSTITAYVYSLGQTNITVGFIPFELPKIRSPFELYAKYFGQSNKNLSENLFGTAIGFTKACQMGAIGVNALEPKGFRDCLDKGVMPKYNDDEEKRINFNTYQIWLLSMLNNEELWDKSIQIATALNKYSASDKNAKKTKSQEVVNLLKSVNRKQFIEGMALIVSGNQDIILSVVLIDAVKLVHDMPVDNVPYFLTLVRFQYVVVNQKS